ncbi:hypothetical protein ACU8L5_25495 (plasmid) [Rhizobium leguminosarum]
MEMFDSYADFAKSKVPGDILWKVIARDGKSKTYTQVLPLDGGTVGIANFAVGGLASLYRQMDTQKYFGRSSQEMIDRYSSGCRPDGYSGNDTGWGCYSQEWWREGMERFVASPESESDQNQAWLDQMRPTVEIAIEHGWKDGRSLAIATGVANSIGGGGFKRLANQCGWRPEVVLEKYVGTNAHRKRREDAINAAFPR